MKISDRLSEYGLIGAVIWLIVALELLMWGWLGLPIVTQRTLELWLQYVQSASGSLATLLGAIGTVAIFVTGVLLDLAASLYNISEAEIFKKHLERNKQWLEQVIDQNRDYIQKDWSLVLSAEWMKLEWESSQGPVNLIRHFVKSYKQVQPILRIQSLLFSYVLLTPGVEGNQLLSKQIPSWNISRAIATAITVVTIVMSIIISIRMIIITIILIFGDLFSLLSDFPVKILISFPLKLLTDLRSNILSNIRVMFILLVTEMPMLILARIIANSAYQRVCATLFAIAYLITAKTGQSAQKHS